MNKAIPEFNEAIVSKNRKGTVNFARFAEWYLKNIKPSAKSSEMVNYMKENDLLFRMKSEKITPHKFGAYLAENHDKFQNDLSRNLWSLKEGNK
jgi:hypothetical protein